MDSRNRNNDNNNRNGGKKKVSEEEAKKIKTENLIFRLNNLGLERQTKLDELWEIERRAQAARAELIKLLENDGLANI